MREQQAPSRIFFLTYWLFLGEIFYSRKNWIWIKVEIPISTIVGDWTSQAASLWTESLNWQWNRIFGQECQPMGGRHHYAIKKLISASLASGLDGADCNWQKNFLQKKIIFLIFGVKTRILSKTICPTTAKCHKCCQKMCFFKRGITIYFADNRNFFTIFFPCMDINTVLFWIKTFQDNKHLQ